MKFVLIVDCANDAFQGDYRNGAVGRLVLQAGRALMEDGERGSLRDGNGNTVGRYEFTEETLTWSR